MYEELIASAGDGQAASESQEQANDGGGNGGATTAMHSLFGQTKFKVNFQNIPTKVVSAAANVCRGDFINVNIGLQGLLPTKETDDIQFFLLMSNHPSAVVPVSKFLLALAYNGNNSFCCGDDKEYLLLKNAKAFKQMIQAAKDNNRHTQYTLGYNYNLGESQNHTKAYHWYIKAHYLGDLEATFRIGRLVYHGLSFEKNYNDALKCFEHVDFFAEQHGEARNYMGMIWETGMYSRYEEGYSIL